MEKEVQEAILAGRLNGYNVTDLRVTQYAIYAKRIIRSDRVTLHQYTGLYSCKLSKNAAHMGIFLSVG